MKAQAIGAKGYGDAVSILISFADGSTGTIIYSSLGDAAVSKEYVEVFASGRVVQLDDFERLTVTAAGKRSVTKAARDKGQRALVAAFLAAMRGERDAPIPLADLAAVCEATFAIARSLSGRLQEQPAPREVPPEDASPIPQDMANAERSGMPAEDFA